MNDNDNVVEPDAVLDADDVAFGYEDETEDDEDLDFDMEAFLEAIGINLEGAEINPNAQQSRVYEGELETVLVFPLAIEPERKAYVAEMRDQLTDLERAAVGFYNIMGVYRELLETMADVADGEGFDESHDFYTIFDQMIQDFNWLGAWAKPQLPTVQNILDRLAPTVEDEDEALDADSD